jgi:hypothetical protein
MAWEMGDVQQGVITNYNNGELMDDSKRRSATVTIVRTELVGISMKLRRVPRYEVALFDGHGQCLGVKAYEPKRKPNPEALRPATVARICAEIEREASR